MWLLLLFKLLPSFFLFGYGSLQLGFLLCLFAYLYHIWNLCNKTIGLSLKSFQVGLDQKHGEVLSTYQEIVKLWHHQFLCHLQPIAQLCVLFLGFLLLIYWGDRTWVWISMCRDMIQYWRRFLTRMPKRLWQRHMCASCLNCFDVGLCTWDWNLW